MKKTAILILLAMGFSMQLRAATYYVTKNGSDSNPGTQSAPWLTVQRAANSVAAGDTVNIGQGTYSENVTISAVGTSAAKITFTGSAVVQQMSVRGSYLVVLNLAVGNNSSSGTCLNVGGSNNSITNVIVDAQNRSDLWGISVNGANNIVDGCTVRNLYNSTCINIDQSARNCRISRCLIRDALDCDAFRAFGRDNTISQCMVTNMTTGAMVNHPDCFQTFSDNGEVSSNIVVEGTSFINCGGQIAQMTAGTQWGTIGPCGYFTFRNNVYVNVSGSAQVWVPHVSWYNNTFIRCGQNTWSVLLFRNNGSDVWGQGHYADVKGNVFLYGGGSPSNAGAGWYSTDSGVIGFNADYNYVGGASYAPKTGFSEPHGVNGGNPQFINEAGGNYRLSATSPLIDRSIGLTGFSVDKDGSFRPQGAAWDIGSFEFLTTTSSPLLSVSPGSVDFGSIALSSTSDFTVTVQNMGSGTLSGVATVSAGYPFTIVGSPAYSLGSGQSQVMTIRFSPTNTGTFNQTVTFTGGGGKVVNVSGVAISDGSGSPNLSSSAGSASTSGSFTLNNGAISQSVQTALSSGGQATFSFRLTNAGLFAIQAVVNAPSDSENSFYINMDGLPTDPDMIWDIPVTSGFESRFVSWRGNGTDVDNQYSPKAFNLSAGTHQLTLVGREANVQVQSFTLVPRPPAPQNLRIVIGN